MRQRRTSLRLMIVGLGAVLLATTGLGAVCAHAAPHPGQTGVEVAVTESPATEGQDTGDGATYTRGRDIVNLSSRTLKFTGWNPDRGAPDSHPPIGALLHPGQTHHYEIEYDIFGDVFVEPRYSYTEPGRRDAPSKISFRLSSKGLQVCSTDFFSLFSCAESPSGVSGAVVTDRSGENRVIQDAGEQWQEAVLAMCGNGKSRCRFDVKSSEDIRSPEIGVGASVKNMTSERMPAQSIALTSTVSTVWAWGATVKASLPGFEITGNVSKTDWETKTFTQTLNFHVLPYSVGYFTVSHSLRRLHGDAIITMPNNSTLHLKNAVIDTPGPGPSEYKFWQDTWHTPGGLGAPTPNDTLDLGENIIGPPVPGQPSVEPQPPTVPRPSIT